MIKLDKDYQNFVDRMRSVEDTFDITDTSDKDTSIKLPGLDLKLDNKSINAGKKLTDKIVSKNNS